MKRKIIFIFRILALCFILLTVGCKGATSKKNSATEKVVSGVVYTCEMHPEVKEKEPGNCPTCGMRLVEKKALPEHNHDNHQH